MGLLSPALSLMAADSEVSALSNYSVTSALGCGIRRDLF